MKAGQYEMKAMLEAWLQEIKACQENTEAIQEGLEANQGETEAVVKHYKWASHTKATYVLTTQQDWASDVLHGDPNEVTYKEIIGALEDQFWDWKFALGYRNQLRSWTQDDDEPLQEVAIAIKQVTHHTVPA
jgi:hypothetical protein